MMLSTPIPAVLVYNETSEMFRTSSWVANA